MGGGLTEQTSGKNSMKPIFLVWIIKPDSVNNPRRAPRGQTIRSPRLQHIPPIRKNKIIPLPSTNIRPNRLPMPLRRIIPMHTRNQQRTLPHLPRNTLLPTRMLEPHLPTIRPMPLDILEQVLFRTIPDLGIRPALGTDDAAAIPEVAALVAGC